MIELPSLTTERLVLRGYTAEDAPALQALASDRRIAATTLNIPHPYPPDGALQFILNDHERRARGEGFGFAITRRDDGALLGGIGLRLQRSLQAEMGYWVGVPYWGQGYTSEAARRLIAFGFDELGLNRIYASYFGNNPASARVMQKAGMIYEGAMKGHILKWGEYLDLGFYGILRSDYEGQGR